MCKNVFKNVLKNVFENVFKNAFLVDPTFCFIIYIYSMQKVGLAVEEDSFVKRAQNVFKNVFKNVFEKRVQKRVQKRVFGRPHFLLYHLYILNAKSGVGCGGGFLCHCSSSLPHCSSSLPQYPTAPPPSSKYKKYCLQASIAPSWKSLETLSPGPTPYGLNHGVDYIIVEGFIGRDW
jgi:hypothetical protein